MHLCSHHLTEVLDLRSDEQRKKGIMTKNVESNEKAGEKEEGQEMKMC